MKTRGFISLCLFLLLAFIAVGNTISNLVSTSGLTPLISTGIQDSVRIDTTGQPQRKTDTTPRFIFNHPQGSDTISSLSHISSLLQGRVAGIIRVDYPQGSDTIGSVQETASNQRVQPRPNESKIYLEDAIPLNNYSFDLYHKIRKEKENILLSPLSTYYALLLAYEGAKNQTRKEFEKVLYIKGISKNTLKSLLLPLTDTLQGYHISNAIWRDNNMALKEKYMKAIIHKYSSEIKQTDFRNKETAASNINNWISEKTNDMVREALHSSHIKDSTSIIIANTVYLKGEWQNKFDKQKTKSNIFFASAEDQYSVAFMHITETLPYYENDLFQCISKPYKDSHLSFCIILPKSLFGIVEIEEKMNAGFLKEILADLQPAKTMISLPKLKLESNWELSDALQEMGLTTAFSNQSDFSSISDNPLSLENIIHNSVIEVDEEKTEAAAATLSTFRVRGLPQTPSYHLFNADHPFLFFVIDNRSKAILFMGRYSKPTDAVAIEKKVLKNVSIREKEGFFSGSDSRKVLYVIDNKAQEKNTLPNISPEEVETFTIIRDKDIIGRYTTEEYNQAIFITLKKKKKFKE